MKPLNIYQELLGGDSCISLVKSRQDEAFVSPYCLSLFTQIGALFLNKVIMLLHFLTTVHRRFNNTCVMSNTMFKSVQLGMCLTLGILHENEKKIDKTRKSCVKTQEAYL